MEGIRRFIKGVLGTRLLAVGLLTCTLILLAGSAAQAEPKSPVFGPMIDPPAGYEGQSKCDPGPKPGVVAFQQVVMRAYPYTRYGSISRGCGIGGQSEHKEGRAWDWGVNAAVASEKAAAEEVIDWLAATDKRGNRRALARRFGIMYLIWNRRIWFPSSGWSTYCVQRRKVCRDPDDGGERHPHTDHVHFSFTWKGAQKRTTYWHRDRSMVAAVAAHPTAQGYWLAGANGEVRVARDADHFGSPLESYPAKPVVAMASTLTGQGYWLVTGEGKVYANGDAAARGGTRDLAVHIVGMAGTSTGRGYWLVTPKGRVFGFGNADHFGDARANGREIVGLAATPTNLGYWLFAADGTVFVYGDAQHIGDASSSGVTSIVGGDNFGSTGYWLVTRRGRVFTYGDAPGFGGALRSSFDGRIIGMSATSGSDGYYLSSSMGDVLGFGNAPGATEHRSVVKELSHQIAMPDGMEY
jgi:hypothetical protein